MEKVMHFKITDKMADIISESPSILQIMSRFGMKLGFGDSTVEQVCGLQGVDGPTFISVVNFVSEGGSAPVSDEECGSLSVPTLLFFLGILLAVDVLRYVGILNSFSTWLDTEVGNVYIVNLVIGTLSAIVDNVPLVAGAMGMYPIATEAMVANSASAGYLMNFMQDGTFWQFLAYCAGVGGSMLIIGSAAGVVVMGLEGINFIWYLKRISWVALAGYLAGALVYIGQNILIG